MASYLTKTNHEPDLLSTDAPHINSAAENLITKMKENISKNPDRFDGDIVMAESMLLNEIKTFTATWAWQEAFYSDPELFRGHLLGALSAGIFIYEPGKGWLWQLRSSKVVKGNTWHFSAAGGLLPGQSFTDAIAMETEEELGLKLSDFSDFQPIALRHGYDFHTGPCLIYAATLKEKRTLKVAPDEVQSIQFFSLNSPPEPMTDHSEVIWDSLKPLLADWEKRSI